MTDQTNIADKILQEWRDNQVPEAASPKHQEIVDDLVKAILYRHNQFRQEGDTLHEVKKLRVSSSKGSPLTFVVIETGMIGDEGTMAAAFCRDYRHIMIGKAGGLSLLNCKNQLKKKGWFNVVHALTK